MRKLSIILTAAVTTVLLSSCQKTYTCECTETTEIIDSTGTISTVVDKYSFTYHAKKKYSDEACLNYADAASKSTPNLQGGAFASGGSISCQSK
ncbi:MAG: hypothetical protein AB1304_11295 [Bacteroidota bacterium]